MQLRVRRTPRAGTPPGFARAFAARRPGALAALAAGAVAAAVLLAGRVPQYRAEARVFVAAPATQAPLEQAAALARSRELARDALESLDAWERPEFAARASLPARALAALGFGEAGREGLRESAVEAFGKRLSVTPAPRERQIAIAFRADDAAFAADAANRVAALFVETGAAAHEAGAGAFARAAFASASVLSRAQPPREAMGPDARDMIAFAALLALTAGGAGFFLRARHGAPAAPAAPHPVGEAGLAMSGFASARLGDERFAARPADALALEEAAARVLSARRDGPTRIFCAALGAPAASSGEGALALARRLSAQGRSILIDFGDLAPDRLRAGAPGAAPGLAELLAHEASFDETIRRDAATRLHLVGRGAGALPPEALVAGAELSAILDALSGAYDFIWLAAAGEPQDESFEALAAQADVVALFSAPQAPRPLGQAALSAGWRARDVLVIGAPGRSPPRRLSLGAA
ncbi:hypothetical protein [Methylocella sp.]|uniref:hypothetical protein n=1 Tax=Methylocella sp. TaxID=1978226 RepID=UPI0035B33449